MSYAFFAALGVVSFIFSSLLLGYKIEPVTLYYYMFAWWSYIIAIDGFNGIISGDSLILNRTKSFALMLPFSAGLWFFFELLNIRMQNWAYQGLPFEESLRKTGYIISYATVLPAIFETKELIENLGFFKKISFKPIKVKESFLKNSMIVGSVILVLILILPKIFFPFAWIFMFLILEPINYRIGAVSLLRQAQVGSYSRIFSLATAAIICGFFWEMWNYNSQAKWIYSFPLLHLTPKLFEMPLHGYIGFPFFALECYAFFNLISWIFAIPHWENLQQKRHNLNSFLPYLLLLLLIPLYIYSMNLIDTFTVRYFINLLP